ncbi:MAG TPA: Mur ligase family protein [Bacteroidia bacterium]|jgi:UDP-N-acetylmuramate: L-alanyl-gamma-D-glutamyl-meso-diaminopimelate ligase|nr:Mur ligase family protein [Bacteroidia bacterium]
MKIHFIAIGGSVMHNMALAMKNKGYIVTGSDDEINEPSRSRLQKQGLLPDKMGWFPEKLDKTYDEVILGMHARADNPELLRAQELGLKVYSYPEYMYQQTKDKIRVVVGGSHGKTTITSMILHVLKHCGKDFDYLVGAQLQGFDTMVKLTKEARVAVFEGDEYLASPIDRRPKFHLYKPHIAIVSGIAWDHINVFPTYENYVEQFEKFIHLIEPGGNLIYCTADSELKNLVEKTNSPVTKIPYAVPANVIENGITFLVEGGKKILLKIFGEHNLMNLQGAKLVCEKLGVSADKFYEAIQSFTGAAKRLEPVKITGNFAFYKDFAHSPSKLKATIDAMKGQFPKRHLVACMELHTFSSLNEVFLKEYRGCMQGADDGIVYFNPHTIEHKKLKSISIEQVQEAFDDKKLKIFTQSKQVSDYLKSIKWADKNLLMMTSGNFDGVDFIKLADELN